MAKSGPSQAAGKRTCQETKAKKEKFNFELHKLTCYHFQLFRRGKAPLEAVKVWSHSEI